MCSRLITSKQVWSTLPSMSERERKGDTVCHPVSALPEVSSDQYRLLLSPSYSFLVTLAFFPRFSEVVRPRPSQTRPRWRRAAVWRGECVGCGAPGPARDEATTWVKQRLSGRWLPLMGLPSPGLSELCILYIFKAAVTRTGCRERERGGGKGTHIDLAV